MISALLRMQDRPARKGGSSLGNHREGRNECEIPLGRDFDLYATPPHLAEIDAQLDRIDLELVAWPEIEADLAEALERLST